MDKVSMFQAKFLLFHIFKHTTSMLLHTHCYELTTSKRILNVVSDTNVISLNYNLKKYYLMVYFKCFGTLHKFFSRELITKVPTLGLDIL